MAVFTTEQLTERWEAHNEITNLVGRLSFLEILRGTDEILEKYWCSADAEPSFGVSGGYYKGRPSIERYYGAVREFDLIKAVTAKSLHPEEFADKEPQAMRGVGGINVLNFTTPVLEIAEDGQTAKGLWYIMSGEVSFYTACGPATVNRWGRVGIDFIKEADGWKLWHVVVAIDFDAPMGSDWTMPQGEQPVADGYEEIAGFKWPELDVKKEVYPRYHAKRQLICFPGIPEPYRNFAETFSYGAE